MKITEPHKFWWQSLGAAERFERMKSEGIKQVNDKLIKRMYQVYLHEPTNY